MCWPSRQFTIKYPSQTLPNARPVKSKGSKSSASRSKSAKRMAAPNFNKVIWYAPGKEPGAAPPYHPAPGGYRYRQWGRRQGHPRHPGYGPPAPQGYDPYYPPPNRPAQYAPPEANPPGLRAAAPQPRPPMPPGLVPLAPAAPVPPAPYPGARNNAPAAERIVNGQRHRRGMYRHEAEEEMARVIRERPDRGAPMMPVGDLRAPWYYVVEADGVTWTIRSPDYIQAHLQPGDWVECQDGKRYFRRRAA